MLSPRWSKPLLAREAAWRIASCATWLVPISNDQPALRSSKSIQLTYCYAKRSTNVRSDMTNLGIGITSTHALSPTNLVRNTNLITSWACWVSTTQRAAS